MSITITLTPSDLTKIRDMDPRVQSYNIEMTELTGGTFWKPYTKEQVEGTEPFPMCDDPKNMMAILHSLHVKQPAINLYEPRIRTLAKALGPVVIRFSGSWATRTYYDFDGHTNGIVPDGFEYVLTKEQWQGALDFVKEVGAQILVSVANSYGVHENGTGAWMPDQATETVYLKVPNCICYMLSSDYLRSQDIKLNGRTLAMPDAYTLPDLSGVPVSGTVEVPPATCTFFVV